MNAEPKPRCFDCQNPSVEFGLCADHLARIAARAEAEWAAMDSDGRLPEGWAYKPGEIL